MPQAPRRYHRLRRGRAVISATKYRTAAADTTPQTFLAKPTAWPCPNWSEMTVTTGGRFNVMAATAVATASHSPRC